MASGTPRGHITTGIFSTDKVNSFYSKNSLPNRNYNYFLVFEVESGMAESVGRDSLYVDGLDTNFCCKLFSFRINFHQYTPGSKPDGIHASLLTVYIELFWC